MRHPASWLALAAATVCVLVSVTFRLYDADAWQHLAVGRAIWTLHAVPRTEVWTWPNYGALNVNPSWGFSLLLWPFWAAGDVLGLYVWRWLSTLAVFSLLWATARRLGARGFASLLVLVLCGLVYRQRSQIRPETMAAVLFAASLWILECRRQGGADRSPWLVPIAWIWANSHVSYYLLFVLLGVHGVDELFAGRGAGRLPRRPLWLIALACAAVSFLNPFGWRALVRPFEFGLFWRHDPLFREISEIRPLDWGMNWSNGLPLLFAGWVALAAWRWRRRGLDRVELTMVTAFTALALTSSRFIASYSLAAAPYLGRDLEEWWRSRPWPPWHRAPWPRAVGTALLCFGLCGYDWTHNVGPLGIGFDMSRSPEHACDFMAAHGVSGRGFNHFELGGYLLWRFWPQRGQLPFMDIHPEDSPAEVRSQYYRALTDPQGWEELDRRFRFDYALLHRRYADRRGLPDLLDRHPRWALVFVDDVAALYVRREGSMAAVARRFGYRILHGSRVDLDEAIREAAADSAFRAVLRSELERQARESPVNFYGRRMLRAVSGLSSP